MKSGSCVKPGGWRWWVGPSFPLGRASGENLVQTGTAPFGYQPLPGTSVPMTHPWYSEVQGQDDVGAGAQHGEGARGHRDHAQSTRWASLRAASCTQICRAVSVQPVPFPVGTPTTHLHPLLEDTTVSTAVGSKPR